MQSLIDLGMCLNKVFIILEPAVICWKGERLFGQECARLLRLNSDLKYWDCGRNDPAAAIRRAEIVC